MEMKIVVVNGFPKSGKTTFEEFCRSYLKSQDFCGTAFFVSTIDFVKEIAENIGWDKTKTPENRLFLSNLKDILTAWKDLPFKDVKERIENIKFEFGKQTIYSRIVVFIDSREPEEIKKITEYYKDSVSLLIYKTKEAKANQSNHSDSNVMNYQYDYIITNNGSLEELSAKAGSFINELFDEV